MRNLVMRVRSDCPVQYAKTPYSLAYYVVSTMGGCLCGRRKDGRILLLGLDGVGKTSIFSISMQKIMAIAYYCLSPIDI